MFGFLCLPIYLCRLRPRVSLSEYASEQPLQSPDFRLLAVYHPVADACRGTRTHDGAPNDARTCGAGAARLSQPTFRPIEAARPQVARESARSLARASAVSAESAADLARSRAGEGADPGASAVRAKKAHARVTRQQAAAECRRACRRRRSCRQACRQAPPSAQARPWPSVPLARDALRTRDALRVRTALAARAGAAAADAL